MTGAGDGGARIGASYDRVAAKYEARFVDELASKPRDRQLLEQLADAASDPVSEIGCGPGQIGAFVRQRGRRVIGVDLSHAMADLARPRLDAALVGDMRALPFGGGSLGGLVAFYSVIHVRRAELGDVFREFARVVRPGGRLLVSAHEGDDEVMVNDFLDEPVSIEATFYRLDELTEAASAAGFAVVTAERRQPYEAEGQTVRLYIDAERRPLRATA